MKTCSKCGLELPLSSFHAQVDGRFGRRPDCKGCASKRLARYYQDNAAAIKARVLAYEAKRPARRKMWARATVLRARARQAGCVVHRVTAAQLETKLAYWGGRCWVCGAVADSFDHVKPLSRKEAHLLANIRPICRSCNARKSNHWPYQVAPTSAPPGPEA